MSVRHRSKCFALSSAFASATLAADSTASPMRSRVSSSNSRISASSSTTRTVAPPARFLRSARFMPACPRTGCGNPPRRLRRRPDVLQDGRVGGAHLARDIQAEAGAAAVGGEEGFEQLLPQVRGHALAVVDHVQFYPIRLAPNHDAHARLALARMAPGIAQQVPQHLLQVHPVEHDLARLVHLQREAWLRESSRSARIRR